MAQLSRSGNFILEFPLALNAGAITTRVGTNATARSGSNRSQNTTNEQTEKANNMETYYYVRRIDHNGQPCAVPRTKYQDFRSAMREAERNCANSPTSQFEILKCVAITKTTKPLTSILSDDNDDLDFFQDPW